MVLLHLFAAARQEFRLHLSAVHIHHGLSANADAWAAACSDLCTSLNIPLQIQKARIDPASKAGLEASARSARYALFQQQAVDFIALAHHRDDQAETVLLQLLRGAGVKGLSAMPAMRRNTNGPAYLRPLLDVDRSEIVDWAVSNGLNWVEDESNQDTTLSRNYLRHTVLPLLSGQHAAWRTTITRSAGLLAEAAALLDELAEVDAVSAINEHRLDCNYLAKISPARARNLLRYFFSQHRLLMPSQARLTDMLNQLIQASGDAQITIEHNGTELKRYRSHAYLLRATPPLPRNLCWHWHGQAEFHLTELQGTLYFRQENAGCADKLHNINIRLRQGGEYFQPDCKRPKRRLKDLLQTANLPPWERDRLPLIYSGDDLIQVPGIGVACNWQAKFAKAALCIEWRPNVTITD